MDLEGAIALAHRMEAERIICRFALGGTIAVLHYAGGVASLDAVAILVSVTESRAPSAAVFAELDSVLTYLAQEWFAGYAGQVGQTDPCPIRVKLADTALEREALREATSIELGLAGKSRCRILRAEHLVAMALVADRQVDREVVEQLVAAGVLDRAYLEEVLGRHDLGAKWKAVRFSN